MSKQQQQQQIIHCLVLLKIIAWKMARRPALLLVCVLEVQSLGHLFHPREEEECGGLLRLRTHSHTFLQKHRSSCRRLRYFHGAVGGGGGILTCNLELGWNSVKRKRCVFLVLW
jgi:hypothetical protein